MDESDGSLAAGSDDGAVSVFKLADAAGEFEDGGRAVEAVGVADGVLIPGVLYGRGIGKNYGGTAMSRRRQRLKTFGSVGIGMDEFCFPRLLHGESLTHV